jgi:hypothetical protein
MQSMLRRSRGTYSRVRVTAAVSAFPGYSINLLQAKSGDPPLAPPSVDYDKAGNFPAFAELIAKRRFREEFGMLTQIARNFGAAAILLLLAMPVAFAGSPRDMDFDGVRITLGQASNQALSSLHSTFDLQPVAGQPGAYTVQTKGKSGTALGIVTFQNGKVVQLERERGNVSDIGQGKIMTTLINELIQEGNTHAELKTDKRLINGVSHDIIILKLPGKRLYISISNPPAGSGQVIFREILE